MSKDKKKKIKIAGSSDSLEFLAKNSDIGSSKATSPARIDPVSADLGLVADAIETDSLPVDPMFRLLADPKLPELPKTDRAKLQMQSPNRLHFYWSVKSNPYTVLDKALGGRIGSYTLVARLKNHSTGTEKILPVDAKGDWWFDVEADSVYQCEIGFYAPNRPYIRIVFSNEMRTPRKTPSLRTDYTPSFTSTANEFAQALDAAGYKKDAFDVALAGDDPRTAHRATRKTYHELTGTEFEKPGPASDSDLRLVLLALAAGYSLAEIETIVDSALFAAVKKGLEGVSAEKALKALEEHFDIVSEDVEVFEEVEPGVFGASLVHFPRRARKKRLPGSFVPKIDELTSHRLVSSPVKL